MHEVEFVYLFLILCTINEINIVIFSCLVFWVPYLICRWSPADLMIIGLNDGILNPGPTEPGSDLPLQTVYIQISWLLKKKPTDWIYTVC